MIDLRSDTVTKPTSLMRRAMAEAECGDDGYGEDPTVARLEEAAAELLGQESALFVVSGTMANQVALRTLTQPGDVVIVGARAHLCQFERGASARNALVQLHTLDDRTGAPEPEAVRATVADYRAIGVQPALVAFENTHMPSGGTPLDPRRFEQLRAAAQTVPVYVDGARIANAAVALRVQPSALTLGVALVSLCLSKGLGAPMGSLLAGHRDTIARARVERQALGGRLRQAGVVAAAGLVALGEWESVLARDHELAGELAARLGKGLGMERVRWAGTNMVLVEVDEPRTALARLRELGVAANAISATSLRFVTHRDLRDEDIEVAAGRILEALA